MTEENKTEKRSPHPLQKIARLLLKVVLFLFLLIVVVFLLVLTPPVQRFLTTRVENYLQNKLKTEVEVGGISFGLTGNINLKNIYIEDRTKDTLVSGGLMKANVNIAKLFSNEVEVKNVAFSNITAKVKRLLPDTVFNFQFIVDAFATKRTTPVDTTAAPLILDVSDIELDNVRLLYNDVITGNDVTAYVDYLSAELDTLNPEKLHYSFPMVEANGITASIVQSKPLAEPEPAVEDVQEAVQPITLKLNLGEINLKKIKLDYTNHVSAFFTHFDIGRLQTNGKHIDLPNRKLNFEKLLLNNSVLAIRLGNKPQAKVVEQEIEKEVAAQKQLPWGFRIDQLQLNNNDIRFDNDNQPKLSYGMDYAHLGAEDLTLHIQNLVLNDDSIGGVITKGSFKERSGFQLNALEGELLYAYNQAYLRNLYLKTPGTELKRSIELSYASYDALMNEFEKTMMEVDIPDSYVQVKDILTFAPQLRSQPAFSNPNDVWHLNLQARGNMYRLNIAELQFDGFKNTRIDAEGTLSGITDPNAAGGTLTIRRLHTTQSDIALFTGQSLSNNQVNLPESFDISGTVSGNISRLNTDLRINTSAGNIAVTGSFAHLTSPASASYNATVRTSGLRIGSILRNPQLGVLSATITASGSGFTPQAAVVDFKGNIYALGFNNYTYRNISLDGSMRRNVFNIRTDANDPNAHFNLTAKGNLNAQSFAVNGFIDSVKTLPLHLTTQPLVFRGQIDADIPKASPDYLEANVLITKALLVSEEKRLALDTLQLLSGQSDTGQFIRLNSDIANAAITGRYRIGDLGSIIQHNIQPYFSTTSYQKVNNLQPYDFQFRADVAYHPIYTAFIPGLKDAETIHAEGRMATNEGMQARANTPYILFGPNEIHQLNVQVNTADSGMRLSGTVDRFRSGNSFDLYNARLNATALNNNIDFNLRIGDKNDRNKYLLSGLLTQPSAGDMRLSLRPDSLLLNYDRWTIAPDNSLSIIDNNVFAHNFILEKNNQQLSLQSAGTGSNQPLNVSFTNFRLSTITGFIKSDSLLVDGTMNGTVTLRNVLQQPLFTSNLTIDHLSFKQDTIGNVNLSVASAGSRYNTNLTITGQGNDIALNGFFAPQGSNDIALDLDMAIRRLQLNTFEGAMASFITSANGAITGNVDINGTASSPKIQGQLVFDSAAISTKVLGGPLMIEDERLTVTESGFVFDQFSIRDSANNAMTLNGNIRTSNFINYAFSLDVNAKDFKIVNSTKKDNKLFYGDLVITSNLHIGGTEELPVVDGSLTVNEGTAFNIVIPQQETGLVEREGVVEFVDFDTPENDSLFLTAYDSLNVSDLVGFDISTNILIQKEAMFNIIVDAVNGDFLNLQGTGQLSAGIDPSGKVSLTGSYEIDQGGYQFSLNFLQRKFTIQKGSKIVWMGEPTSAEVDVTAVYIANTAPIDLVESQITSVANRNIYLQRLPFQVLLRLGGELMKPNITFDIRLPSDRNYNVDETVVATVNNRLATLRQQPSELNKQVFAILLLNRFVGENPFESSSGGFNARTFARQSVSKLLTEQLNNLAAGLINGVDINFDVASSNDYSTGERRSRTDLNVGLSKRLLNDRLTVTVGSNFQLEGPQQVNQSSNNIAGNVSVNYQLSKDGRYLLRFYRQNEYEGTVDGYVIETGLGFILNVDYNHIMEILNPKKYRKQRQENTQNQQQ